MSDSVTHHEAILGDLTVHPHDKPNTQSFPPLTGSEVATPSQATQQDFGVVADPQNGQTTSSGASAATDGVNSQPSWASTTAGSRSFAQVINFSNP